MNSSYIKKHPRGSSTEIASVMELLPICIENLNIITGSLSLTQQLKISSADADINIIEMISDVENQGRFNTFLNLCFLDFIVIYKNSLSAIHLWDDLYSLRQGYLLIYETLKTYKLHSKSLKDLAYKTSNNAVVQFNSLTEKIKSFKRDFNYENNILEIRNYTIGHIDKDPYKFFDRMSKFDEEKAFSALKEFVSILVTMLNLSDYIFVNRIKMTISESSLLLARLPEYSIELDKLIDGLESQTAKLKYNGR